MWRPLGVVYLNLRTAPAPAPVAPEAPPAAEAPPVQTKTEGADLWEDLRKFAAPPPALADENGFRDQARRSTASALPSPTLDVALPAPAGVHEPRPTADPKPKSLVAATPTGPAPGLDFLIRGPAGSRAWLDGRPYRSGENVPGQPLKVGAIGSTSVELQGPKGKTILSTNPLHHSGPSTRSAVEAP